MTSTPPASGLSVERIAELRGFVRRRYDATPCSSLSSTGRNYEDLLALLDARLGEVVRSPVCICTGFHGMKSDGTQLVCARCERPSPVPAAGGATEADSTAGAQSDSVAVAEVVSRAKAALFTAIHNEAVQKQLGEFWVDEASWAIDRLARVATSLEVRWRDDGWQDISTAPQGKVVLFCDARGNRWSDCSPDLWRYNGCGYPPTHWMPLPRAPKHAYGLSPSGVVYDEYGPTPTEPGAV